MKSTVIRNMTLTLICLLASAMASAQSVGGSHEILQTVKTEVKKCAVKLVSRTEKETTKFVKFQSICDRLHIISERQAQLLVDGTWYTATITESEDADGGDLNNMVLTDDQGKIVATRTNVVAYEQVILAMTGGDSRIDEKIQP